MLLPFCEALPNKYILTVFNVKEIVWHFLMNLIDQLLETTGSQMRRAIRPKCLFDLITEKIEVYLWRDFGEGCNIAYHFLDGYSQQRLHSNVPKHLDILASWRYENPVEQKGRSQHIPPR